MMLDYLIKNATVYDGDNIEPQQVDVGIAGEGIAAVGQNLTASSARRVIDAAGLTLTPGFIDTHASTGLGYRFPNAADNKLFQGVTSEIIGNCGTSTAPIGDLLVPEMQKLAGEIGFEFDWRTLAEWFTSVEQYGLPFNSGTFVGHSTLRAGTCLDRQQVGQPEIDAMAGLLNQALSEGALGLSTGLVYAPGSFADTAEIITLAKLAAQHGGIYVSHIRDERQHLEESIDEAIEIASQANLPILVSHLKAAEKPNWGKIPRVIEKIEKARSEGLQINFEVYPYPAVSTKLRTFIPKDALADGVVGMQARLKTADWRRNSVDWLVRRGTNFESMIMITDSIPGAPGKSIADLAERAERSPGDMVVDILLADADAWIVYHCIDEQDMDTAILWEDAVICSDSWSYPVNAPRQIGNPHPRTFGAFTRFLEQYALNSGRIPLGQAIRKITALPADWVNIPARGRIREGYFADLVLLDLSRVKEKATYADPRQFSEGTEMVWVNGTLMLEAGEVFRKMPGKIITNRPPVVQMGKN